MLATCASDRIIHLPDIRHTQGSLMLKQGIHLKIVQERQGHSSIQLTLDTCSHVVPVFQETAVAQFEKLVSPRYNNTGKRSLLKSIIIKLLA